MRVGPRYGFTVPIQKPDLKPSTEFKDNITRRNSPVTRSTTTQEDNLPSSSSSSEAWSMPAFTSASTSDSQPQSRQPDLATESEMGTKSEAFEQHTPTFSQADFVR